MKNEFRANKVNIFFVILFVKFKNSKIDRTLNIINPKIKIVLNPAIKKAKKKSPNEV